jgi:protein-tyrosine phosphatase
MAAVLVVCTGNVCRSPVAEGLLRAAMQTRFGGSAPTIASAGVAGWKGSKADAHSIESLAERGIDISSHRGRRLSRQDLADASVVIAMAYEHSDAVVTLAPEAIDRTFTLKELVRLLESAPVSDAGDADAVEVLRRRIDEAAALRRAGFEGNAYDEDIADPLGLPLDAFRAMTWEIGEWVERLDAALFGVEHARASASGGSP